MPKLFDTLVNKLKKKGKTDVQAHAIATSTLQKAWDLKPWTTEPTAQWIKRGNMTHSERVKTRIEAYRKWKKIATK